MLDLNKKLFYKLTNSDDDRASNYFFDCLLLVLNTCSVDSKREVKGDYTYITLIMKNSEEYVYAFNTEKRSAFSIERVK